MRQVYTLYHGPFLQGFTINGDSRAFTTWVESKRAEVAETCASLLFDLTAACVIEGQWAEALGYLEDLLELCRQKDYVPNAEDLETIYGLVMVAYAHEHQLALAKHRYEQYKQGVAAHSLPPKPGLQQLAKFIEAEALSHRQGQLLFDKIVRDIQVSRDHRLGQILYRVYLALGVLTVPEPSRHYDQVLLRAGEEAACYGDTMIGTPHLTLALCTVPGVPDDPIFATLERALRAVLGDAAPCPQNPDQKTLALQRVLRTAAAHATTTGAPLIDVPHLWNALWQEEDTLLSRVLMRFGEHRGAVLEQLEQALEDYQA
jgi:hypothetical protein